MLLKFLRSKAGLDEGTPDTGPKSGVWKDEDTAVIEMLKFFELLFDEIKKEMESMGRSVRPAREFPLKWRERMVSNVRAKLYETIVKRLETVRRL